MYPSSKHEKHSVRYKSLQQREIWKSCNFFGITSKLGLRPLKGTAAAVVVGLPVSVGPAVYASRTFVAGYFFSNCSVVFLLPLLLCLRV